jgi:hypothetical protein
MCREQGILNALLTTLSTPFVHRLGGSGTLISDMAQLSSAKFSWVRRLCTLAYQVLMLLFIGVYALGGCVDSWAVLQAIERFIGWQPGVEKTRSRGAFFVALR